MTFRLAALSVGSNPLYWPALEEILSEANIEFAPNWAYQPYAEAVKTLGGGRFGRGYPIATWNFEHLTAEQRYTLRQICADLSARVYIETPTNDFDASGNEVWIQASAVMNWTDGEEDRQGRHTIGTDIVFTEIVEVS